jgi:hypothetical protein
MIMTVHFDEMILICCELADKKQDFTAVYKNGNWEIELMP